MSRNPSTTTEAHAASPFRFVQYEHLIAGLCGGSVSTLLLHPFDLLKIRFSVDDGKTRTIKSYRSILSGYGTVIKEEGVRSLYKGAIPNIIGAATSWGLYFFVYNIIKKTVQEGDEKRPLTLVEYFLSASTAGAMTLCVTNPVWVVKTRLCLQYSEAEQKRLPPHKRYSGMIDAFSKIRAHEGIRGLYSGFIPGLLGVSHGAIQFMVYENLKNSYNRNFNQSIDTKLSTAEYLTFSAVSKIIAALLTYPYQVVRARLQNQHHEYRGVAECVRETWRHESWRGFYKGLALNLYKVTPATMLTFLVYENVSRFLFDLHE